MPQLQVTTAYLKQVGSIEAVRQSEQLAMSIHYVIGVLSHIMQSRCGLRRASCGGCFRRTTLCRLQPDMSLEHIRNIL
jgi:hypothetical protein